jgi:hypothetical protein
MAAWSGGPGAGIRFPAEPVAGGPDARLEGQQSIGHVSSLSWVGSPVGEAGFQPVLSSQVCRVCRSSLQAAYDRQVSEKAGTDPGADRADVGLPDGSASGRRRTPGLRREEVAQLSGVGVTWYTWLEQGRE